MVTYDDEQEVQQALDQILGYLNFSAGAFDPALLSNLNRVWGRAEAEVPAWQSVAGALRTRLAELQRQSPAFQDTAQASAAIQLVFDGLLPRYLEFHRDLLFHQSDDTLFNSFFVGRAGEALLQQGPPWEETDRVLAGGLRSLNDYVGYRPVATLESRKMEPYAKEWLRPVPLYVQQAGTAVGRYHDVVERALALLRQTDDDLLRVAYFDPEVLDELAFDPRAYDFDHPVNKRPNYHFGQWDPHRIDNQGRYRRFVIQQVTLDALMQRLEEPGGLDPGELLYEAAAVLAGTILMASGISGAGPDSHDSTTSLSTLLPRIAAYRDEFYDRLSGKAAPAHARRLREEARQRRQPFGAARQHLNAQLARRRASQLEHVQLAKLFSRMGYAEAATQHAVVVPTTSARMLCEIDCRLTRVRQALDEQLPAQATEVLPQIVELLQRGIACGALIDPWNILGFDAQFSLFPALENSVHDHRADELVELLVELFSSYSRAWAEAAAGDNAPLCQQLAQGFLDLAHWWRQYAAHEVANVQAFDPLDAYGAAEHVAKVLNLWHRGGAASGDLAFWAPHAELFQSPQAYALVIEALFEQSDHVAGMALLIHWLSASARIPLEQGDSSFHRLAERWLVEVAHGGDEAEPGHEGISLEQWRLVRKYFDYLEANAEPLWKVPDFRLHSQRGTASTSDPTEDPLDAHSGEADPEGDLYGAAYEDMVFRDSTDDGIEGALFDTGQTSDDSLAFEAEAIASRLAFHATLARLWRTTALRPLRVDREDTQQAAAACERNAALTRWARQAEVNRRDLFSLLAAVNGYQIPLPLADHDSMMEYDRRRMIKESLLEQIIGTTVETIEAARLLAAARGRESTEAAADDVESEDERPIVATLSAVLHADLPQLQEGLDGLIEQLEKLPLLYVPLARGGDPVEITAVRARQRYLQFMLKSLPRLGLLLDTCRLIETARDMERNNPVGPGAVTEFDDLFKTGFRALVHALCDSAETWEEEPEAEPPEVYSSPLVTLLEQLTEALLVSWLAHSRTLRLSVMEKATEKRSWKKLVAFIERFGGEVFTQRFLNIGNIRAILHQGCEVWLQRLEEEHPDIDWRLLSELGDSVSREEAVEHLTLVLETVVENYGEYRDYNSTTTQSDRGEMLYTLLDFLRLRARYDRVCWNLKPVVIAHEILVRRGQKRAAQIWRRALRDRIGEEADKFQKQLCDLQRKHSMQMPSIADRIAERFVRPMVIDRICSLVEPAIAEARKPCPRPTFRILQYEIEFLTREPSGVGFDVPAWLQALEEEIHRVHTPPHERDDYDELQIAVPVHILTHEQIEAQLDAWADE